MLAVESPEEKTEIVIHVNMLKEGWDVTNLYTIVPLRAANSRTLVEQSIGRGLRLPFGKRVGVNAVDRLTIVAHDKFSEIVDEANRSDSVLKVVGVYIGKDVAVEERRTVTVAPALETALFGNQTETAQPLETQTGTGEKPALPVQQKIVFENPIEREIAQTTLEVIRRFEYKPSSSDLRKPEIQAEIIREVKESLPSPAQASLTEVVKPPNFEEIARKVTEKFIEMTIDIPKIIVVPTGETIWTYRDFDLDTTNLNIPPTSHNILLQSLQTNKQERLADKVNGQRELMLENYLVKRLIDFDDISYDDHADLLYKLSEQTVNHLRSYMSDETAVCDTIQFESDRLAKLIYAQMFAHQSQNVTDFEVTVTKGFTTLRNNNYTVESRENVRDFRAPVDGKQNIRSMHFGGFQKCLYPMQKFDSDSERRFSIVLENDTEVLKWFKPAKGQLPVQIFPHQDRQYEPDFVVETQTGKFLCEVKREDDLEDADVQSKKTAAKTWCENASRHETENGGKPWQYVLISHNSILGVSTFAGIVSGSA